MLNKVFAYLQMHISIQINAYLCYEQGVLHLTKPWPQTKAKYTTMVVSQGEQFERNRPVGCWSQTPESLVQRQKCTLVTTQSTKWSKTQIYHMKTRSSGISHWVKSLPSIVTMTLKAQAGRLFGTTLWTTLSESAVSSMRPQRDEALKNFPASLERMSPCVYVSFCILRKVQCMSSL